MRDEGHARFGFFGAEEAGAEMTAFGRVLQLQHDAIVGLRHQLERGQGLGIVKVAENDDQAAIFDGAGEFLQTAAQPRRFVELEMA